MVTVRESLSRWLALTTLLIIIYNISVIWIESTEHPIFLTLLATITPFTGAYQPLPGQDDSPSEWMSAGIFFSLFITMSTLVSLFIRNVRVHSRRRLSLLASHQNEKETVLLIGDSSVATNITKTIPKEKRLIHFTANALPEHPWEIPLHASRNPLRDTALAEHAQQAGVIIVAMTDTAENISIAEKLSPKINTNSDTNKPAITCLVSDSHLSDQLRPSTIKQEVPTIDLFNPEENIAQHVAELVMFLTTSRIRKNEPISVTIVENSSSDLIATVVESWLTITKESIKCIKDKSEHLPEETETRIPPEISIRRINSNYHTEKTEHSDISIILGSEESVAVEALKRARDEIDDIVIAVTRPELLQPIGSESTWLASTTTNGKDLKETHTICVNPNIVAYSLEEVSSGMIDRWARAYHLFYGMMMRDVARWNAHTPGKNEESSKGAVKNMLTILDKHGYALKRSKGDNCIFDDETAEEMAQAEHESWRGRTWFDTRTQEYRRVVDKEPGDGLLDIDFDDLDKGCEEYKKYKKYNLRVPQEVYPAIATLFGYRIVPKDQTGA